MGAIFVVGLILIGMAAIVAGIQTTAYVEPGLKGLFASAHDVWAALWPDGLAATRAGIEGVHPLLWDPLLRVPLMAPAWALLGLAGAAAVLIGRRRTDPEMAAATDSLGLYDRLAKRAGEEPALAGNDTPEPEPGADWFTPPPEEDAAPSGPAPTGETAPPDRQPTEK
jgi:hypothetical protein